MESKCMTVPWQTVVEPHNLVGKYRRPFYLRTTDNVICNIISAVIKQNLIAEFCLTDFIISSWSDTGGGLQSYPVTKCKGQERQKRWQKQGQSKLPKFCFYTEFYVAVFWILNIMWRTFPDKIRASSLPERCNLLWLLIRLWFASESICYKQNHQRQRIRYILHFQFYGTVCTTQNNLAPIYFLCWKNYLH